MVDCRSQDVRFLSLSTQGIRPPPVIDTLQEVAKLYYGDDLDPATVIDLQELDNLFVQMGVAQDGSVRHEPVACEPALSPFPSAEIASAFNNRWHFVSENGITPSGFGLLPDELGPEGYPSIQTLRIGRRGGSREDHELPEEIWYPMAVDWA